MNQSRDFASPTTINDEETADCDERQSFLEPLPLLHSSSPKANNVPLSKQLSNNKKLLYPHTRRKYCTACCIHPPLRSHHCKICNRCCATFDHHCQFLDTCIGERNHFRFWLFVLLNVVCLNIALRIVGSSGHVVPKVDSSSLGGESQLLPIHPHHIGHAILIISKLYMYTIYFIAPHCYGSYTQHWRLEIVPRLKSQKDRNMWII